jgi:hypothetical protein
MAGYGLLSGLLRSRGLEVTVTDKFISHGMEDNNITTLTNVIKVDALKIIVSDASKDDPSDIIIICWAPYDDPIASQCLNIFTGSHLILIGEGYGGCTADHSFFDQLDKKWNIIKEIEIPQFYGIHDNCIIYERKVNST